MFDVCFCAMAQPCASTTHVAAPSSTNFERHIPAPTRIHYRWYVIVRGARQTGVGAVCVELSGLTCPKYLFDSRTNTF